MELKKYKLADIAKIEISGVDKKTIEGETPVRLCNFVDVYYNWAVTKEKQSRLWQHQPNRQKLTSAQ